MEKASHKSRVRSLISRKSLLESFIKGLMEDFTLNPQAIMVFNSSDLISFSSNEGLGVEVFGVFVTKLEPVSSSFLGIENFFLLKQNL